MNILYNHDLTKFTGFKTPVTVKKFVLIEHEDDFDILASMQLENPLIIGGGTNYLFDNPEINEAIIKEMYSPERIKKFISKNKNIDNVEDESIEVEEIYN